MFVSAAIAVLTLAVPQASKIESIKVKNVSAAFLAKRIQDSLDSGISFSGAGTPKPASPTHTKAQILVDAASNSLVVKGQEDQVVLVEELVKLFDVKPIRVLLTVHYALPDFGIDSTSRLELANMEEHRFKESAAGFELTFSPRVNGDGTVTIKAQIQYGETTAGAVGRLSENGAFRGPLEKPLVEFRLLRIGG